MCGERNRMWTRKKIPPPNPPLRPSIVVAQTIDMNWRVTANPQKTVSIICTYEKHMDTLVLAVSTHYSFLSFHMTHKCRIKHDKRVSSLKLPYGGCHLVESDQVIMCTRTASTLYRLALINILSHRFSRSLSLSHTQRFRWARAHTCTHRCANKDVEKLTSCTFTNSLWMMPPIFPWPAPLTTTSGSSIRELRNLKTKRKASWSAVQVINLKYWQIQQRPQLLPKCPLSPRHYFHCGPS